MSRGRVYRPRLVFWLVALLFLLLIVVPAIWSWFTR